MKWLLDSDGARPRLLFRSYHHSTSGARHHALLQAVHQIRGKLCHRAGLPVQLTPPGLPRHFRIRIRRIISRIGIESERSTPIESTSSSHPWHAQQVEAPNNRNSQAASCSAQLGLRPRISLELIPPPAPSDRSYSDAAINEMIGAKFSLRNRASSAEEHGTGNTGHWPRPVSAS